MLPNDLPPWWVVHQQTQRWIKAEVFETMVHDLRELLRLTQGKSAAASAAILDSRTRQGTPESAGHAGSDGAKKKKGSKVHIAVDTLGYLLGLLVTPADQGDRTAVAELTRQVQEVTGDAVEIAWVDQGYTGDEPAQAAEQNGIELVMVKLEEAKRGFVLLPRRWVVERSFALAARFRRLAKDYERLPETVMGLHFLAFASLIIAQAAQLIESA